MCGGNWSVAAASVAAFANAVREVYTAIKHAEKDQPDPVNTFLVEDVMLVLVRTIVAKGVAPEGIELSRFSESRPMQKAGQASVRSGRTSPETEQLMTPIA